MQKATVILCVLAGVLALAFGGYAFLQAHGLGLTGEYARAFWGFTAAGLFTAVLAFGFAALAAALWK